MIRSSGPFAALERAAVEWDAAGHPRSLRFGDGYFGNENAVAESRHVFLRGSDLPARLESTDGGSFAVGELGFGTGLNFLLTWQALAALPRTRRTRLHFLGIDRHPMPAAMLERALEAFPECSQQAHALVEALPPPVPGIHRRLFDDGRVVLDLYWADAADALRELASLNTPRVDAWYLDGFAPSRNPAMWRSEMFRDLARASRDGASIASYSAAGAVRRGLEAAGFGLTRRPGFGRKRECIRGQLASRPAPAPHPDTPWDLPDAGPGTRHGQEEPPVVPPGRRGAPRGQPRAPRALVLGAGLAGAHAAAALARRGWLVTVLEAGAIADRASGNPQGVLFTRLSHKRSILSDFSLVAFLFASDLYRQLLRAGTLRDGVDGALCGCLQTAPPRGDFAALGAALADLAELASACDPADASARLATRLDVSALWQARSGWLAPPAVCRALLAHDAVEVRSGVGSVALRRGAGGEWQAHGPDGGTVASAPVAIIAAGSESSTLTQLGGLPLRSARGQTTQIPALPDRPLGAALSHRGYVAPAVDGEHCIGATFNPGDTGRDLRSDDHRDNLAALAAALPAWRESLEQLDPQTLAGRAELRCVSPDYLPLAGPVPDGDAFRHRFAALGHDASATVDALGPYLPGLYLSTAHGSRGLSYAALCGELLASQICGEAPPLPRQLARAVAPARFTIRAIVRGTS